MTESLTLIPKPLEMELFEGVFAFDSRCALIPNYDFGPRETMFVKKFAQEIKDLTGILFNIDYAGTKGLKFSCDQTLKKEAYEIEVSEEGIDIKASDSAGFFYGLKTLKQLIAQKGLLIPYLKIKDCPVLSNRGFFIDLTRGRVLKLSEIKKWIDLAANLKYNQVQLYFEHTYAYSFFSEINLGKDGITSEELREIDDYCYNNHIEMIPCIATFGHIFEVLSSDSYSDLCEYETFDNSYSWMKRQLYHTIDCTNDKSFKLIEAMLEEIAPLIRSKYINICGDETYDLGKGRSKKVAEEIGKVNLYIEFLNKTINKVEALGKKAMFWGDVIINHPSAISSIQNTAMCMYWQYEEKVPEEEVTRIQNSREDFYLCCGSVGWNRFINDYSVSYHNVMAHGRLARKYGALGMVHTDWGDFGHFNEPASSIPTLYMAANVMWSTDFEWSMEVYAREISKCHYGTKTIVPLFYEISMNHRFTLEHLMKWFYERYQGMTRYGSSKSHFTTYTEEEIADNQTAISEKRQKLLRALPDVNASNRSEVSRIIHMCGGMDWLLELVKVIKKYTYKEMIATKIPALLAVEIELWYQTYEQHWRLTSRESELIRIREVIVTLCHYLRTEIESPK